jgi:hypothetical protein
MTRTPYHSINVFWDTYRQYTPTRLFFSKAEPVSSKLRTHVQKELDRGAECHRQLHIFPFLCTTLYILKASADCSRSSGKEVLAAASYMPLLVVTLFSVSTKYTTESENSVWCLRHMKSNENHKSVTFVRNLACLYCTLYSCVILDFTVCSK